MISNVEHLLMYPLTVCLFWGEMSIHILCAFFKSDCFGLFFVWLVLFCLLLSCAVFYILDINPLLDI